MVLQEMNASPYHPKVKTTVRLGESLFVAGGVVAGKMQVECKAEKGLGLGRIMVELFAIEELTSRDHSARSTFLHTKRIFQGTGLPPSNAVHPHPLFGEPPLPLDYHPARKGTTTFLFRFPLPDSCPSSINFGSGLANVKYEVRASVAVSWKGEKRLVTDKKELDVVESCLEEFGRTDPEAVIVGENGKIWVQGKVIGGFLVAGQPACVELQVKNHSTKKNSGLSITLIRELHLPKFPMADKAPLRITETLTSVPFRGQEYVINPGTEGLASLVFDVPVNARGVKGGEREASEEEERHTECLFEVRCILGVKLAMGLGSKDINLDISVRIMHPQSVPELPYSDPPPPMQMPSPYANPPPQVSYALPVSPGPYFSPQQYPLPPMSPIHPYIELAHQPWAPPPIRSPLLFSQHMSPYPPDPSSYYRPPYGDPLPPPPQPFAFPLRPSSAEPIPSHSLYNPPTAGLPIPIPPAQQPLIPLAKSISHQPLVEREAGKGERASRIAHHLRLSSRHRSVSPQAHRYPIPTSVESRSIEQHAEHVSQSPPAALRSSPEDVARQLQPTLAPPMQMTIPTGLSMDPDVVSPRPMPSPKQTYSLDPFTHATLARSERVEALERIAAHAEEKCSDMSHDVPEFANISAIDNNKTLPAPPVPSQKPVRVASGLADSRPMAQSLFVPREEDERANATPPTPTLAAVTSLKPQRVPGGMSGLDALEARLLAEVGTRKIDVSDKKRDVRSVLPITIPKPPVQDDPLNDSAISSLNLPGLGADEMTKIGGGSVRSGGTYRDGDGERGRRLVQELEELDLNAKPEGVDVKEERKEKKKKKERESDNRDQEAHRLRRAAQGRIAAWLDSIDPVPPSPQEPARRPTPHEEDEEPLFVENNDPGPDNVPEPPMGATIRPEPKSQAASVIVAEPNPRSSGFMPISTIRLTQKGPSSPKELSVSEKPEKPKPVKPAKPANLQKRLPAFSSRPLDPEVRYDIRSARGGRGGHVTAIAAIWASASDRVGSPPSAPTPRPPVKAMKPTPAIAAKDMLKLPDMRRIVTPPSAPGLARAMERPLPPRFTPPTTAALSPTPISMTNPATSIVDNVITLAAKRAKMAKASGVPAVVSSSLATPMLSSTASLARPVVFNAERTRLKNQLSPGISDIQEGFPVVTPRSTTPTPAGKGETAFGQNRLKELIKKYQTNAP